MKDVRGSGLIWWSAMTILVSAFLLFQVQPLISKTILPWFGGSPAVWTTCVLFFQVVLLGGYAYAHMLKTYASILWQQRIHTVLLVLAVITLPIVPGEYWKPDDGNYPALRILLLLLCKVGMPFFLLSTTGPLVQSWFALALPGRSPYWLYALSNIGSLAALLSYPFLFEPAFRVTVQGWLWSFGFVVFAFLAGAIAIMTWRIAAAMDQVVEAEVVAGPTAPPKKDLADESPEDGEPQWYLQAGWVALAALGTTTLLSFTDYVCQDIAVVPFMWVIPLSLYLLSFIFVFAGKWGYPRVVLGVAGVLLITALCAAEQASGIDARIKQLQDYMHLPDLKINLAKWTEDYDDSIRAQSAVYMGVLFVICMLCHGELVRSKPAPRYLTKFYMLMSAGGAVGGIFVGLICPQVFAHHYELNIAILGGFLVAWVALARAAFTSWLAKQEILQWSAAFVVVGMVFLIGAAQMQIKDVGAGKTLVTQQRNFYGTIAVKDAVKDEDGMPYSDPYRSLYHGRILHGIQYLDESRMDEATTYYDDSAGPGIAVREFPGRRDGKPVRVAVVGLGTGTMAAHAKAGDYFCFYDIDPKVVALHTAQPPQEPIFKFIQRARGRGATIDITLGDARIQMEREAKDTANPKNYDVLVLDAFTGDAIPAHLLTVEALEIYEKQMRHDEKGNNLGILAVHISNRYLDLHPVVRALARKFNYTQVPVHYGGESDTTADTSSDWILLTRNQEFLTDLVVQALLINEEHNEEEQEKKDKEALARGERLKPKEVLWTDQYNNLFGIMK